jgi:hypothetical protein
MSQDINFKPLFDYLDEQFGEVKSDIADVKHGVHILQTSVGSFAKTYKDNGDEIKVVNHRVNNQENWIKRAGSKIGLEYKP